MADDPPTGAPTRPAALPAAATALLAELTDRYAVDRRDTTEPPTRRAAVAVPTVRLLPRSPAAGPLAVAFTGDGVVLRLGRWYAEPLPVCGCGDCAGADAVADLRLRAYAHVEGGLWERVRRGVDGSWAETRLVGPGLRTGRRERLSAGEARAARREGFAAAVRWAPWPVRP